MVDPFWSFWTPKIVDFEGFHIFNLNRTKWKWGGCLRFAVDGFFYLPLPNLDSFKQCDRETISKFTLASFACKILQARALASNLGGKPVISKFPNMDTGAHSIKLAIVSKQKIYHRLLSSHVSFMTKIRVHENIESSQVTQKKRKTLGESVQIQAEEWTLPASQRNPMQSL